MSTHSVNALAVRDGCPITLEWNADRITAIRPASGSVEPGLWIAPPLFDLQVNGYGGVDFQSDHHSEAELLRACRGIRRDGCTRFLLTLITDEWPRLIRRLAELRRIRSSSPELCRSIAGWHVEGPFLSERPGFHGAHDPTFMMDPTLDHIRELRRTVPNDQLLITLAPERQGAIEAIRLATSLGMTVSLGHTDASAEVLKSAVEAGGVGFTHLGNGCPQTLDRHDNLLWRVLDRPPPRITLIPDGQHVSPPLFRLIHRLLGRGSVAYITDAMSAAGAPPGRYRLGSSEFEVGSDQVVRKPGANNFAGSALRPIDGVLRAARMLDCPWSQTWLAFSDVPARWMQAESRLEVGDPPEFCLVRVPADGDEPTLTIVAQDAIH